MLRCLWELPEALEYRIRPKTLLTLAPTEVKANIQLTGKVLRVQCRPSSVPSWSSAKIPVGPLADAVSQRELYTITEKRQRGQLDLVSGCFFFPLCREVSPQETPPAVSRLHPEKKRPEKMSCLPPQSPGQRTTSRESQGPRSGGTSRQPKEGWEAGWQRALESLHAQ